jgi:hypothetical protein
MFIYFRDLNKYMKYCLKCLKTINEKKDKYVMFIVKTGNKINEFKCFHVSCWKKHFEQILREYRKGGSKKIW